MVFTGHVEESPAAGGYDEDSDSGEDAPGVGPYGVWTMPGLAKVETWRQFGVFIRPVPGAGRFNVEQITDNATATATTDQSFSSCSRD